MKKKIIISIMIVIITILSITIVFNTYNSKVLFQAIGQSWSQGYHSWGYIIRFNGVIERQDSQELISKAKIIGKEELNQLKELANKVEDSYYIVKEKLTVDIDRGSITYQVYSKRLSKWVVLSSEDAKNSTDTSSEILELTNKLYNKYLNN